MFSKRGDPDDSYSDRSRLRGQRVAPLAKLARSTDPGLAAGDAGRSRPPRSFGVGGGGSLAHVTSLLPETPLAFPTVVVSSTNDPRMRSDKAAFWAGFWSASFLSIGAAGSIDEESGFGPWPQGLEILDQLRSVPPAHVAAAAKSINRATLAV